MIKSTKKHFNVRNTPLTFTGVGTAQIMPHFWATGSMPSNSCNSSSPIPKKLNKAQKQLQRIRAKILKQVSNYD